MTSHRMMVRGHYRLNPNGDRRWIDGYMRAYGGGETVTQQRERERREMIHNRLRYGGYCQRCGGTGWVFREPKDPQHPTTLCPACEGSGRGKALTFPARPTIGQIYPEVGAVQWTWDGRRWNIVDGDGHADRGDVSRSGRRTRP